MSFIKLSSITSILKPRPSAYTLAELMVSFIAFEISLFNASAVAYSPNTKAARK
jgi:hypothetical protein